MYPRPDPPKPTYKYESQLLNEVMINPTPVNFFDGRKLEEVLTVLDKYPDEYVYYYAILHNVDEPVYHMIDAESTDNDKLYTLCKKFVYKEEDATPIYLRGEILVYHKSARQAIASAYIKYPDYRCYECDYIVSGLRNKIYITLEEKLSK